MEAALSLELSLMVILAVISSYRKDKKLLFLFDLTVFAPFYKMQAGRQQFNWVLLQRMLLQLNVDFLYTSMS